MNAPRSIMLVCVAAMLVGAGVWFTSPAHRPPSPPAPPTEMKPPAAIRAAAPGLPYVERLTAAGWEEEAAQGVVGVNLRWWCLLAKSHPERVERQVSRLTELPDPKEFANWLRTHPETSGLFLASSDPAGLLDILNEHYPGLTAALARNAVPGDLQRLQAVLARRADLLCRLEAAGLHGAESILVAPPGASCREYDDWVAGELESRLRGQEGDLDSFFHFALADGVKIRQRLIEDKEFQSTFRERWGRISSTLETRRLALEDLRGDQSVWDLTATAQGGTLLTRWGTVALDLLHGPDAYRAPLRGFVRELLEAGHSGAVKNLHQLIRVKCVRKLLEKHSEKNLRLRCLHHLGQKDDPIAETARLLKMEPAGLERTLTPAPPGWERYVPLYSVYDVTLKEWDGRGASSEDIAAAAIDIGLTLIPAGAVFQIGGAAVKTAGGLTAKEVAKTATRTAATQAVKTLGKEATRRIARETPKRIAAWTLSGTLRSWRKLAFDGLKSLDKAASLDVTELTRAAFRNSGMGRALFKKISGLEPRIFMRADRRVQIRFLGLAEGQNDPFTGAVASFFHSDDDGQKALKPAAGPNPAPGDKPEMRSEPWRENLSAWWLLHATNPIPD